MDALQRELRTIIPQASYIDTATRDAFLARCETGMLTREEDSWSHFSLFFTPIDPVGRRVLFVHHKKAGLWISPGGHLEQGESVLAALNREMGEELGLSNHFTTLPPPSFGTIKHMQSERHPCRTHFDIWFFVPVAPSAITVHMEEFHDAQWWTPAEVRAHPTDENNLLALSEIERSFAAPCHSEESATRNLTRLTVL